MQFLDFSFGKLQESLKIKLFSSLLQGVSAKIFEPNNSVIFQQIFVKFKMQIF
jgi:hypothetical protein